jgi:dolichol-phosphate mannosyltransferase
MSGRYMTELDIVIPVHNESENIVGALESFRRHVRTPFRVLICYDHEDDSTLPVARRFEHSLDILLVRNTRTGAHGAIRTGFEASRAAAVLVFPADDTYNAPIIDRMVEAFRGGCDIVCASRFMPGGRMERCPWLKAALVRSSAFTLYHLARLPSRDPSNGLRLFSRRVLQAIPIESSVGFTYSLELLVKCHRLGWRVDEVPAQWFERHAGQSRFRVLRWLPAYLRWYVYAFATTYLRRGPRSVRLEPGVRGGGA